MFGMLSEGRQAGIQACDSKNRQGTSACNSAYCSALLCKLYGVVSRHLHLLVQPLDMTEVGEKSHWFKKYGGVKQFNIPFVIYVTACMLSHRNLDATSPLKICSLRECWGILKYRWTFFFFSLFFLFFSKEKLLGFLIIPAILWRLFQYFFFLITRLYGWNLAVVISHKIKRNR